MKYVLHHASPAIIWPGFHIETKTGDGAAKLAEELNRLDTELVRTRVELQTQIEAKNNALRKVTDLEALGVELELRLKGSVTNRALKQRLSVRTGQVRELLDVLERAQGILADYIEPNGRVKPREALTSLLGVLDDGEPVSLMRNLRASEDVAPKFLKVGDEMLVTLKRGSDGKQYVSGFGVGLQYCACVPSNPPFTLKADQVYINGTCIEKSSVSAIELGTAIHEGFERVVNNTVNHFAPSKKLKRRVKKLRARVSELENARDELLSEIRANAERD